MKEKTIYALLMTMIPGLSLAAETPDTNVTPIKARTIQLKEEAKKQFPTTPELRDRVSQGVRRDIMSAERAERIINYGTTLEKQKKDQAIRERFAAIEQQALKDRMAREMEQRERFAQEQATEADRLIAVSKRATEEKLKENQDLASTISNLKEMIEAQRQEIETTKKNFAESDQISDKFMEEMAEALKAKEAKLIETMAQLSSLQSKEGLLQVELFSAQKMQEILQKQIQEMGFQGQPKVFSSSSHSLLLNAATASETLPIISSSSASNADTKREKKESSDSDNETPEIDM